MAAGLEENSIALPTQTSPLPLLRTRQFIADQITTAGQILTDIRRSSTAAMGHSLPAILVNTMPKSGSIYIGNTIASSLGIEFSLTSLAHGVFPTYTMSLDALHRFKWGNIVRQEHIDASPINLETLNRYVDRIVLHIRDPRQAMISWAHHLNRTLEHFPDVGSQTIHPLPADFARWNSDKQIDWHIENHMESLVAWLRQWLECTPPFKILWTNYEDLVHDERALFERICAFFEVPPDRFQLRTPSKTITYHYRSADPNEWKSVLTDAQKKRCAEIVGRDILDRFKWNTM